jgi:hypothetical protein
MLAMGSSGMLLMVSIGLNISPSRRCIKLPGKFRAEVYQNQLRFLPTNLDMR